MKRVAVLLITFALIAGMVGCPADPEPTPPVEYSLTLSSNEGGEVTTPGEGVFTYADGTVVSLVAEAEDEHRFVNWVGDAGTIADVDAASTTIIMDGNYSITASFVAVYNLTISSTEGGSVSAPGHGTFTYDEGMVVDLAAEADEGYRFMEWTGDVGSISYLTAASTTVAIVDHCSITARFAKEIRSWHDLHAIRDNLSGHYVLVNDLDSTTAGYAELAGPAANGGRGWQPIGTAVINQFDLQKPYVRLEPFTGRFDGQKHELRDLSVNRPDEDAVGLFGAVDEGGVVENTGVTNTRVIGNSGVGGLVGANAYGGTLRNAFSTGSVTGAVGVGGLVGANGYGGAVSNCYSTSSVNGHMIVGGLVGANGYEGTVTNSYSTGSATATMGGAGGLVGANTYGATIHNSYSTGKVTSDEPAGGLVANNWMGLVNNCFWDTETSEMQDSAGGVGRVTSEMRAIATFVAVGWDITTITLAERNADYSWNVVDGQTYPLLSWEAIS